MSVNRKQISLAVGASVLLHGLLLFLWALAIGWLPTPKPPVAAATPPPIRLQMVPPEENPPPIAAATPTPKPFLDTASREAAEHPPDSATFESNQDTRAASRLPATGDAPLPTQQGKTAPNFNFDTTAYMAGDVPAASAPPSPPQPAAAPPRPASTPRPTPSHTPVPDEEFGLVAATPTPPEPDPLVDPAAFRSPESTSPPLPTVASRSANRSNAAGFQAQKEMTSVSGNIGRNGDANVDSVATPAGRYKSQVVAAIQRKWYTYFYSRSDLISFGMVRIHLVVDRRGKVLTPQILSNSSNEAMASVSLQAIADAPIPPMPPDAATTIEGGQLSMYLTFNAE